MGSFQFSRRISLLSFLVILFNSNLIGLVLGARKLNSLYRPPSMALTYHKGDLLEGNIPVSIIWYGKFSPSQKSIIVDFLLSLNPHKQHHPTSLTKSQPSVTQWWHTIQTYIAKAGKKEAKIILSNQFSDENCSLGKILKKSQIREVAERTFGSTRGRLTLVLTAEEVAVEGFCMSNCGFHGSNKKADSAFIWVGNSATQCPGQCAWPFHQPIYGPQNAPLGAPNGDVGLDGMIINIASLLAGTVTNPFGNGYFLGSGDAPVEAASACTGMYGKGAYPGYAGKVLLDASSGGSYNAHGVNGRKYLLPAVFNPLTSRCSTVV